MGVDWKICLNKVLRLFRFSTDVATAKTVKTKEKNILK